MGFPCTEYTLCMIVYTPYFRNTVCEEKWTHSEFMIRNTLLGNEGSTPRAKGVQAVSVRKICEGHVSRISQSLQNASSSKGVRPGLICGAKLFRRTLPEGAKKGTCLPRAPAFTNKEFKRETGQERDFPREIHTTEPGRIHPFGQKYFNARRVEPDFICKNLASTVISQKTREADHNKPCNLEVE